MSSTSAYAPDFIVTPGEILEETLETKTIAKGDFAKRTGLSMKTISLILAGKAPILPETALQFERVLGVSAEIWTNLESRYRLDLAKKTERAQDEELTQWVKNFPRLELAKRGAIPTEAKGAGAGRAILSFFGVGSTHTWNELYGSIGCAPHSGASVRAAAVSFRKAASVKPKQPLLASWLRLAELAAQECKTESFDKRIFERAVREARSLTAEDPKVFFPRLLELCARSGVAFVLVPAIPGCGAYGATRWLTKGKALLALSNLRKSDDQFWFSFFHEAGHLILHDKDTTFIEGLDCSIEIQEEEANVFARELLIDKSEWLSFIRTGIFYPEAIIRFASHIGIAPGIVLGALQHDKLIKPDWHNSLKRKFEIVVS